MKGLKLIQDRNEEQLNNQLKLVENVNKESLDKLKFLNKRSQDAEGKNNEIKEIDHKIDYNKLACIRMERFMNLLFLGD